MAPVKLIIQIPCFNEEKHLPETLEALPTEIEGVDIIERLVIDDGSADRTAEVARACGVEHVIRLASNRGLANAFRTGVRRCLELGADIIVNTDADNQYHGGDIPKLVAPVVEGRADMVIGDRQIASHREFGAIKKFLQRLGSQVISTVAGVEVSDATSGFRAISRDLALRLNVISSFTYTHETIIQAGLSGLHIENVPIRTNLKTRPSRLFRSTFGYIRRSAITIIRIYVLYRPFMVFSTLAGLTLLPGVAIGARFLNFYISGDGDGHVQSLLLSVVLLNLSFILALLAVLADLIGANRRLIEETLSHARANALERRLRGVAPGGDDAGRA